MKNLSLIVRRAGAISLVLTVLFIVSHLVSDRAMASEEDQAQTYSYRVITVGWGNLSALEHELNKAGAEGWKLVAYNGDALILMK